MANAQQSLPAFKGDNLSVRMEGAVGDGIADDRAALSAAVRSALAIADQAGSDSISLIIPNGNYYLSSFDGAYSPATTPVSGIYASAILDGGSTGPIATATLDAPGNSYVAGEVVLIAGGTVLATATITTVASGVPTAISLTTAGNGYVNAAGVATSGGSGTGLTITVSVTPVWRRLSIVGRGATITTALNPSSSSDLAAMLYVTGNLGVEISGIKFVNTHPLTSGDTCAIRLWGGTGLSLRQPHIHDCEFRNFSRPISCGGYDEIDIHDCRFIWDEGRDSGGNSSNPNVGVWAGADQVSNPANNTRVTRCYFDGCANGSISGTATQKWCADGLVYGQSNGWLVKDNIIVNHSFEAIYVQARIGESGEPTPPTETVRYPCIIGPNLIDDGQPPGSDLTPGPGAPDIVSLRCEESESLVKDHVVRNAVNGMAFDGINVATPSIIRNLKVSRNRIFMVPGSTGNCNQGMYFNNCSNPEVTDNLVVFDGGASLSGSPWGLAGIALSDANTGAILKGNIVRDDDPGAATTPIYSYWLQQSTDFLLDGNQSIGVAYGIHGVDTIPEPSGTILNHTWTGVATPLSGNFSSILLPSQVMAFTPGSGDTGWYNILDISAAQAAAAGRLTVTSALYDNRITDVAFDFDVAGYGQDCTFVETRFQNYNLGVISAIRASNNSGSGQIQIDVQVSTATAPQPITVTLEQSAAGVLLNQSPTYNPTPLTNVFELVCGEGVRTNAGISAMGNSGFGTPSPSSALHVFRPGSTQVNLTIEQSGVQAWYAGMAAGDDKFKISNQSNLTPPMIQLDPAGSVVTLFDVASIQMAVSQTSPPLQVLNSAAVVFHVEADGSIHPQDYNAGIYAGTFTNPNGHITANTGAIYLNSTGGSSSSLWVKESGGLSNTGWEAAATNINLLDISNGYGTIPGVGGAAGGPSDLAIGAGGSYPDAASFGFGDGTGYLWNILSGGGGGTVVFTFSDQGVFTAAHQIISNGWMGSQVSAPSDANAAQSFDFADGKTGNLGVDTAPDHTGAFPLSVGGAIKALTLEATILAPNAPVVADANKKLAYGQIDLGSSTYVKATGLTAGQIVNWDGAKLASIGATGVSGFLYGPDASAGIIPVISSLTISLTGTIPSGLGLTYSFGTSDVVAATGVVTHDVTDGIITS